MGGGLGRNWEDKREMKLLSGMKMEYVSNKRGKGKNNRVFQNCLVYIMTIFKNNLGTMTTYQYHKHNLGFSENISKIPVFISKVKNSLDFHQVVLS